MLKENLENPNDELIISAGPAKHAVVSTICQTVKIFFENLKKTPNATCPMSLYVKDVKFLLEIIKQKETKK